MAEKDVIPKQSVRYSGLTSFKDFYSFLFDVIKDEGYDAIEDSYSETLTADSKKIEAKWSASKKLTDYFKTNLNIKISVSGLTDVQVEINGKTKMMNQVSSLSVEIKGTLVSDYQNQWQSQGFYKFLGELYTKYLVPKRTSQMKSISASSVENIKEEVKAFLELTGKLAAS